MIAMKRGHDWDPTRFRLEEQLRAVEEFEEILVRHKRIPDACKLLFRRDRFVIEVVGGVLLGVNVAVMAILVNFVLFNTVLHASF